MSGRTAMTRAQRVAAIQANRHTPSAEESARREANPMQQCPDCGTVEVSHWYCTSCLLPMGPGDWQTLAAVRPETVRTLDAARAARDAKRASPSVQSAHPSTGGAS